MEKSKRTIIGLTRKELEGLLSYSFEDHRGRGYFYNDINFDDHASYEIIYDKLISHFAVDERETLETQIESQMSKPVLLRIMDQGCGYATTLSRITHRFAAKNMGGQFLGYGVSGDLKVMSLGFKKSRFELTEEEKTLIEKYGIHPFNTYRHDNVQFFGIEDDLHQVMGSFPYNLDLVLSDHTYFHLIAPWLALKRTADRLTVGGVAMIRTLFQLGVRTFSHDQIKDEEFLGILEEENPGYELLSSHCRGHRTLAVIKREDVTFKTNLHLGLVIDGKYKYLNSFYSKNPTGKDLIAVDTF